MDRAAGASNPSTRREPMLDVRDRALVACVGLSAGVTPAAYPSVQSCAGVRMPLRTRGASVSKPVDARPLGRGASVLGQARETLAADEVQAPVPWRA
jgi:hypothetical protein